VQNIGDKNIAGLIASSLANIFELQNDIAVADEMTPIRHPKKKSAKNKR